MNTSILGVQWISRAKIIFLRNLLMSNFCCTWAEQYWASGRKPWGRFLKQHSTGPVNFSWGTVFIEKRSTSETSAAVEISTCRHSTKTFWQCCQSCILFLAKNSLKKNILFGKKHLYECFGSLSEKSKFCRVFLAAFPNRNLLLQNNFQRKKVFLKEISIFMMTFES